MVYTVTFNPSLDYIITVNDFQMGKTNRTTSEQLLAGGKGINVSVVLKNLGIDSIALGFIAGFTGDEIKKSVLREGINCNFIKLDTGNSRINVKFKDFEGTEINGLGPIISDTCLNQLFKQLEQLQSGDILVLAGSIPASIPHDIYRVIIERLNHRGIYFVVDATKDLLLNVLNYKPFLIKPNHHELGEIFNVKITTKEEAIIYAKKLIEMGAYNVLVSLGGDGAVLIDADGGIHQSDAPGGTLVNAVGAGDSMVAGFLAGWLKTRDYEHAFKMGISSGSASAFSEFLAKKEEILKIYASLL